MGIFDRQPTNTNAAWERDKKRAQEREAARLEEERKNALAKSEETGLMHGDPSLAIEERKARVERDQNKANTILQNIQRGI